MRAMRRAFPRRIDVPSIDPARRPLPAARGPAAPGVGDGRG